MKSHLILGVDPGFSVTGYSLLKKEGTQTTLLDCGYLKMSSTKPLSERVGIFYATFQEKITTHPIAAIALETSFLGKNTQSFLKLGYLRGILYLLADQYKLTLHEFAPREVKAAVTGFGGASKEQVANMVIRFFPQVLRLHKQQGTLQKLDVTDAIAIGLCGVWHTQQNNLLRRR